MGECLLLLLLLLLLLIEILIIITFKVGVDTAKVRVSRSAKEEENASNKEEVAEEKIIGDEKETIPVLKPSIKADESDAVNAIQVAASSFRLTNLKDSSKVEPQKELTEEAKKAEEIEVHAMYFHSDFINPKVEGE